jgi:tetratricopeptide (TPR) repeat protein
MQNAKTLMPIKFITLVFILFCAVGIAFGSQEAAYNYNQRGLVKLKKGDYNGAVEDFKIAYRYLPDNKEIRYNLGAAYNNYGFYLLNKNQIKTAIEKFEAAYYYDPRNVYTLYNLGQAYYQIQNLVKAKECLEKAYKIDPKVKGLAGLLEKVRRESVVEKKFDKINSAHFIVSVSSGVTLERLSYIKIYLEDAYGRVGMLLNYYPKNRVVAVLYSNNDYDNLLYNRSPWALALFDGKVRIPANKKEYTNEYLKKIIYHEYAHALVYDMVKNNCPLWLNEGIASVAESLVVPVNQKLFKKYIEGIGFIPFGNLPNDFAAIKNKEMAVLAYAEFHLLVDFIIKRKELGGLRQILAYLRAKKNIVYAVQKVFGLSMADFEKSWMAYISDRYNVKKIKRLFD